MPSGYTAAIQKGCTFNEFLLSCARAFGALISMRDDPHDTPIPNEFKTSRYDFEQQKEAEAELARLLAMSEAEANKAAEGEYFRDIDYNNRRIAESRDIQKKYTSMLEKAKAWIPPSDDHRGLLEFMVKQIQDSMRFDDMSDYYEKQNPVKLSGFVWKEKKRVMLLESIERHKKEYAEECDRVAGRNEWVRQLRASMEVEVEIPATS